MTAYQMGAAQAMNINVRATDCWVLLSSLLYLCHGLCGAISLYWASPVPHLVKQLFDGKPLVVLLNCLGGRPSTSSYSFLCMYVCPTGTRLTP